MTKTTRTYHHGDLRNALMDTALAHIEAAREVSFTLRELAGALGVSSAAPFRHFPSKRALLAALAEAGFARLAARYDELDAAFGADPVDCFRRKGVAYVQFAVSHQAYFLTMYHPDLGDKSEFPALKAAYDRVFSSMRTTVAACREKNLLRDFDVGQITLTAWSTVHGLASLLIQGQLDDLGTDATDEAATRAAEAVTMITGIGFLKPGRAASKK
ncbi:MAG TPA: WHG domain-containing protein [Noviherbaspirillum sp.]|uniref:TetR/AcrR family transcriptional regulator n=1 Tax=Noviherbaspirillum sp. TaxID=1926288 RepID=UPI002D3DFB05|nr:WHG domain-containing protein [Noviherbaspirillum sp.]HYD94961.1 WHG domain-containing protein [Noviherbaspirillum sp.]